MSYFDMRKLKERMDAKDDRVRRETAARQAQLPNAVPKPPAQARVQAAVDRAIAQADRLVYAAVTERDGGVCRVCGSGLEIARHHLLGRDITTLASVCLICQTCHGLGHVRVGGVRLRITGDADQRDEAGRLNGLHIERRTEAGWEVVACA